MYNRYIPQPDGSYHRNRIQEPVRPPDRQPTPPPTALDPKLMQAMAGALGNTGVDSNQKALLHALSPYVSAYRVQKLERAMQAAKLAGIASGFLSAGGLQMLTGR